MSLRCRAYSLGGSQCQLFALHTRGEAPTPHSLNGPFAAESGYSLNYEWTDESELREANRLAVTHGT